MDIGEVIQVPPAVGPIPAERDFPLTLLSPFDEIHSVQDPHQTAPQRGATPTVQTPKRQGGPWAAPTTWEARTSRNTDDPPKEVPTDQFGIPSRHDGAQFLDVTQDVLARAKRHTFSGWPDFAQLFGDNGGVHLTRPNFDAAPYRELAFGSPFTRQEGADPVSAALAEAGAALTDQGDLYVLGGWGTQEFLFARSHFLESKLPGRRAREHPNVNY